ncbi:MAG: phosphoribosyltransferase [Planctomycetota bacterium]|jgi:hypoxanthine phosphoribosyltransferase
MTDIEKVFITATQLEKDSWEFAADIYDRSGSFDLVIGITRGGAQISIYLHEVFCTISEKEPDYRIIEAASYKGINSAGEVSLGNIELLNDCIKDGDRILLVDDIFDRGLTLKVTKEAILETVECSEIELKVAALYYKPDNSEVDIIPDFYFKAFEQKQWLFLPHELQGLTEEELKSKGFKWGCTLQNSKKRKQT